MNKINDQDDNCNDEQQMNQSASYVPEKTEKPQDEKDYEYGPQHRFVSVNFLPAYVQPRSRKMIKRIGIGIPSSHYRM